MKAQKPISVSVVDYKSAHLMLRWRDPVTKKYKTESSGETTIRKAHLAAAKKESELNSRNATGDGSISWANFVFVYSEEHLESLKLSGKKRALSALQVLKKLADPETLADVTGSVLSSFATKLRSAKRSESTISTNLRTIKAALQWAVDNGHLDKLPPFPKIGRAKGTKSKGRPLTDKEFLSMLQAVRFDADLSRLDRLGRKTWRRLLIGLWLSGLRLDEALRLTWDYGTFRLDTTSKYPVFVVTDQKSGRDQTFPLTPDFGKWILRTPHGSRHGFVFPLAKSRHGDTRRMDTTSKTISAIGKASKIVVSDDGKKFASAHDLRRSFGLRWSQRVMPAELQQLMRHDNITTTMTFYALVEAQHFAEKLWAIKNGT